MLILHIIVNHGHPGMVTCEMAPFIVKSSIFEAKFVHKYFYGNCKLGS